MTQDKDEMTQEMRARECLADIYTSAGLTDWAHYARTGNMALACVAAPVRAMTAFVAAEREREGWRPMEHAVGDKVVKPHGYPFPGTVVAAFWVGGGQRFVVDNDLAPGMLHIFSPAQLAPAPQPQSVGEG